MAAGWLVRKGFANARALAPAEQVQVGSAGVCVHAALATHRGHRYGFDRWRSAANMYLIDTNTEIKYEEKKKLEKMIFVTAIYYICRIETLVYLAIPSANEVKVVFILCALENY